MRRSFERVVTTSGGGTKPAVYVIHVAEISAPFPNPLSASSSSSSSYYSNLNHYHNNDDGTKSFSSRELGSPRKNLLIRDDILSVDSSGETARENGDDHGKRIRRKIQNDNVLADELVEDTPHEAWYRITYKVRKNCNSCKIRMPYWLVCITRVENTFCNTSSCNIFK
jgi:hypothetical protein